MEAVAGTHLGQTGQQKHLTRKQKQAIGLLSIGTFLEYFDLMLYVHMAVLLNELFFPKTDPHMSQLLGAFAFCSTYVFRIFGALIFGYIGDKLGRKHTVVLTTLLMGSSCLIMANAPTYAQVGITASWIMIICRVLQGMSSMGEIIGAQLYLTETIKRPIQYVSVSFISSCSSLGGFAALGVSLLVTLNGFNWRLAFWFGLMIATIGVAARIVLRETPEFVDATKRLDKIRNAVLGKEQVDTSNSLLDEKVSFKTSFYYFITSCTQPIGFYFIYFYCSDILRLTFHYTPEQIVSNNFIISIIYFLHGVILTILSYFYYPLKILRVTQTLFTLAILSYPFILNNIESPEQIFWLQIMAVAFKPGAIPADSIFFSYFPVFKRFRYSSILYAIARAVMHIITSVGLIYIVSFAGHYGLWFVALPVCVLFFYAIRHFEILERSFGRYPEG